MSNESTKSQEMSLDAKIPKLVHLSYKTLETVPDHWKPSIEVWKTQGWTVMFHSDQDNDELVKRDYSKYYESYKSFPYVIQRVDMVRLCYLHKWGGVWCDLDLVPSRDLYDELKDYPLSLIQSPVDHKCYTNMFMAGEKSHPFWIAYLDAMKVKGPWWAIGKHLEVMYTTGPSLMDQVVRRFMQEHPENPVHTLPKDWIVCNVCNIGESDEGVLKVVKGQSWNGWDSKVYGFVFCNRWKIALVLLLLLVLWFVWKLNAKQKNSLVKS